MAESKPSGFKTFILLLITLILAFLLGCGAILMLSPELEIFGVSYASNTQDTTLIQVPNSLGVETDLKFDGYEKIVISTTNASVKVLCGTEGTATSQIFLDENSMGYLKTGSEKEYNLTCQTVGQILYLTLTEPDYSFLTLTNSTSLNLKINSNYDLINNVEFDITTTNGSVYFGGSTASTYEADAFNCPKLATLTTGGNIILDNSVSIGSSSAPQETSLNLTTTSGYINLNNNINAKTVSLASNNGKITTQDFTLADVDLSIESYNSLISLGNVKGNVSLNTTSGIFEADIISGSFTTGEDLSFTNIVIGEIIGNVGISKVNGNFAVNIGKTRGEVDILGGTKNVVLGDIWGGANVELTSGTIIANINASCNNNVIFTTTTGSVVAKFGAIVGDNVITTERGKIDVKFVYGTAFFLNAETGGKITKVWENLSDKNPIVDKEIGETPLAGNKLTLNSTYGNIVINGTSA